MLQNSTFEWSFLLSCKKNCSAFSCQEVSYYTNHEQRNGFNLVSDWISYYLLLGSNEIFEIESTRAQFLVCMLTDIIM